MNENQRNFNEFCIFCIFQENINVGIPFIKANQFIYNLSLKGVNLEVYRTG